MVYAFNWVYDFDPAFPVHVFPYQVEGEQDKLHWHDYYEIGLCVGGRGRFIYLNKEYAVEEGDIFLSNNFENHVAISDIHERTKYLFLIFLPSFIADPNGRQLDLEYLFPFNYNPVSFENKVCANSPIAARLGRLIRKAHRVYEGRGRFHQIELDIMLREILLEVSKHFIGLERDEDPRYMDEKVQKAIQYMNLHFGENLTLETLAGMLDISASYFRHIFKRNTNTSVKQYITALRMSQAKKLLLSTDQTVGRVIEEVGYNNVSQFYRIFTKHMQMSPMEYRRRYRCQAPAQPAGWEPIRA